MDGLPVARIEVGYARQEATNVQWPDAAHRKGLPHDQQRQLGTALAAAFSDPIAAVCWN